MPFCGEFGRLLRFIPTSGVDCRDQCRLFLSMAISTAGEQDPDTCAFVVLELFNNNLFEPWLYGKKTGVSAVR